MRKRWAACLLALLLLLPMGVSMAEPRRRTLPDGYFDDCPVHGEVHSLLFQTCKKTEPFFAFGRFRCISTGRLDCRNRRKL